MTVCVCVRESGGRGLEACKRRLAVEHPPTSSRRNGSARTVASRSRRACPASAGHVPRSLVKLHFADDVRREVASTSFPTCTAGPHRGAARSRQRADLQEVKLEENAPLSFVASWKSSRIALATTRRSAAPPRAGDHAEWPAALEQMPSTAESAGDRARPLRLRGVDYTLRPDEHDATTANASFLIARAVMPRSPAAVPA